ncbi:nuclear receptor-interacting protein 1 [Hemicordylus capensis]|uniref:nuclear receptor-interacting protein 1 n=1 Tax=Hemicordylus capensis TaxID=884348 RepID=UPI0023037728|nr:nuclear receptor-interacting protein 1 [Hemicordylus capensis]XP_053164147.1 nuclear receptor-interacting protein 1 [Hemicordylus capensis]XP_053164148.1 nuclear receptor-interacting protein 1 [Hemicordylus capensis]XP_053164149.1 nuclear receptor-interacting protein 1 [Hemicordylus capensis]XP_053164150.1 nuclear receptor-interacting protein 1 [Hemicordylus capensis]XP_053164152.1 nuclear receptor-interacting protein 1 [Hemicordylus capensis]XP_053164153.1 nuclear receptor-interacting pro
MTHGEELVSEMHQDSVVLTYLEGLLMHQAAGGSGSVVDKKPGAEDQNLKVSGNTSPSCQRDDPVPNTHTYRGSGMLHHKKARLLQSSEDWNAAKRRRLSDSIVDLNGKKEALLAGMVENVPKGKQDSTLLASLLQSFSSRLQSVALSQQIRQSLKEQGYSLSHDSLQVEKDLRCYGVASSHLKTLLKKNKAKDEKLETSLPELTSNLVKDRFIESSHSGNSGPKVINEPLSCAARLQAVASMVEKRSSPATSPKPSVACSQLALLLSSEAHLQQYSREHALKAQNANQIASERLAAMARLKESTPKDLGHFKLSKGMESHLNGQARSSSKSITNKSNMIPFQSPMGIIHSSSKSLSYKATMEKNHLKPPTNSSLLLHLLKNHNATKQIKGYEQNEKPTVYEESSTPTTVDEYSDNNPSFTEDDSSDDESSHSNCLPIDLSFKQKTNKPDSGQPGSLDKLTQSLLHNWDTKAPYVENVEEKDPSKNTKLNPHQKVTLLQLLLGHKSEDDAEKNTETKGTLVTADVARFNLPAGNRTPVTDCSITNRVTPISTPPLLTSTKADSPINLSHHSPLLVKHNSPPYTCIIQPERMINPASKHLIDLTVHKELQGTKQNRSETVQTSSSFSASKLLQNLAQCGMQSSMSVDEQRQAGKQIMTLNTEKPLGLIDGLNSSMLTNKPGTLEENKILSNQPLPAEQRFPSSEIQNLLERRTVLQLLLGTSNKGMIETKERMLSKEESLQDPAEKTLNEQILTVKIKAEPSEESNALQNQNTQKIRENVSKNFQGITHSLERNLATSPASEEFKPDPLSPQDFSFSKNGLLSRLLRQNQDGYSPDDLDRSHRNSERTFVESNSNSTVPKKRKLHSEPSESSLKILKGNKCNMSDAANNHKSSADALYGSGFNQKEFNFSRTDAELKYSSGLGSNNESENRSWSRESKGFNVLKQLLLSENCEKDMSQHRSSSAVADVKKKGSKNNITNNKAEFSVSSLHTLMDNPGQPANCLDHRTFQYSVAMKSPASSPFTERLGGTVTSKPECDQFSVCHVPSEKGPIKWVIADMDKNEHERDSPRLTKTNPILYYMLQKGGNAVQETHGKDIWNEPSFTENSSALPFKKELTPVTECKIPFHNVRNPYSNHLNNVSLQHNVNGEVYGLLGKVLTIKKEPE